MNFKRNKKFYFTFLISLYLFLATLFGINTFSLSQKSKEETIHKNYLAYESQNYSTILKQISDSLNLKPITFNQNLKPETDSRNLKNQNLVTNFPLQKSENSNSKYLNDSLHLDPEEDPKTADIIYKPSSIQPASQPLSNAFTSKKIEFLENKEMLGFTGSNIANNSQSVKISQEIILTLPENLDSKIIDKFKFYPDVDFTKTVQNNTLKIKPVHGFSMDTDYIFGLKNDAYCPMSIDTLNCDPSVLKPDWSYAFYFSTVWKDSRVIGKTQEGRDIIAHFYGRQDANKPKILLTGAIHGEEWKAGGLWMLREWLDNNPNEIRGLGRQIIIVDEVNIDGAVKNRQARDQGCNSECMVGRLNSRNVNLNRNFLANWTSCDYLYLGQPANCGSQAGSESETQAIVNLTISEKPTHLITYHSRWPPDGIIFLGDTKNSKTQQFAKWVSDRTGYPVGVYTGSSVSNGVVPGDQAVWSQSIGVTSLLIETRWRNNPDWDINFNMYKALIRDLEI
jgi:hypothetical protein